MATETKTTFEVFAIDRDNGDGRYVRRLTFRPFAGPTNLTDARGLVLAQDIDGGLVGAIEAPEGTRLEGDALALPDGTVVSADDAWAAAGDRPYLSLGLRRI